MKVSLLVYLILFLLQYSLPCFAATPLLEALDRGDEEKAVELIKKGKDINVPAGNGFTPLDVAIGRGLRNSVDLLLKKGANVTARDKNGMTPLHIVAAYGDNTDFAKWLVAAGADVNARDKIGATPLFTAVYSGHYIITEWLLQKGVDTSLGAGKANEPPYHYAVRAKSSLMAQLLLLYGADAKGVEIPNINAGKKIDIENQGYVENGKLRYINKIYVKYKGEMFGKSVDVEYVILPKSGLFKVVSDKEIKIPERSQIAIIGLITHAKKEGGVEKTVISDVLVSGEHNLFSSFLASYNSFLPPSKLSPFLRKLEKGSQLDPRAGNPELRPRAGATDAADAYKRTVLFKIDKDFRIQYQP